MEMKKVHRKQGIPAPGKVRSRLSLTRLRQRLWRENRPLMLANAAKGIAAIAKERSRKAENLALTVAGFPMMMTPAELRSKVISTGYSGDFASFIRRARKHKLLAYQTHGCLWINRAVKTNADI